MKNKKNKFAKTLRVLAIIAFAAVIGFSMAACDDDSPSSPSSSGYLPAPTGLSARCTGGTLYVNWNSVSGASGYNLYVSLSSSFPYSSTESGSVRTNSYTESGISPGYTFYIRVAAYNSNGTEGAYSNTVSVNTGSSTPTYSINGNWRRDDGMRITISGSSGTITVLGSKPLVLSAASQNFVKVGDLKFKNITSSGNNTWTAQNLTFRYNTKAPDVCISVSYESSTLTLSADGNTLSSYTSNVNEPNSTWYRY